MTKTEQEMMKVAMASAMMASQPDTTAKKGTYYLLLDENGKSWANIYPKSEGFVKAFNKRLSDAGIKLQLQLPDPDYTADEVYDF